MSRFAWMLMLAGLFAALGCEQKPAAPRPGKVTSEHVRRDAGQAVKTAAEFSQQTKDEFQKNLEVRLKHLDAEIAKLREKGRELRDEAKANWDQKMADLETKRDAVRAKLAEVVLRARRLGRTSRREPSRPGTNWPKPSATHRRSSKSIRRGCRGMNRALPALEQRAP